MLKRFFAIGAALVVAFSLSLSSFADDCLQLGFPYFGRVRFSKGSTVLYIGTNGDDPITGIRQEVTDSSSAGSSYIAFDLYPFGTFSKTFSTGAQTISYDVPAYYGSGGDTIPYSQNDSHGYQKRYTASISSGSNSISIQNNIISGGDYIIFGQVEYPAGSVSDVNDVFTGTGTLRVQSGNHFVDISNLEFKNISISNTYNDIVQFAVSFTVPYSMQFSSIRLMLNTKSSFDSQIQAFSISTGGFEYTDDVNSVAGLSSELAGWFSGLKSGISSGFQKIASFLTQRDEDAAQAEESADHEAVSEAQSQVSEIEAFESGLNSSISESVSDIDFTVPSSFGAALGAVGFVFGGMFSDLGGYQIVITIPLILGIMLVLIGRGTMALGRIVSANARASRQSDKGGEA